MHPVICPQGSAFSLRSNPMNLVHSAESAVLREEALIIHPPKKAFRATAELLINAEPVSTQHSNGDIFAMFEKSPELGVIPVIDQRKPVGLINRNAFMQNMARPFFRELYLRKPCTALMDKAPLIVTSQDRKSTRLNSSHITSSYAVFCLKKKIRSFACFSCLKYLILTQLHFINSKLI